jgi:hypothetical protein
VRLSRKSRDRAAVVGRRASSPPLSGGGELVAVELEDG